MNHQNCCHRHSPEQVKKTHTQAAKEIFHGEIGTAIACLICCGFFAGIFGTALIAQGLPINGIAIAGYIILAFFSIGFLASIICIHITLTDGRKNIAQAQAADQQVRKDRETEKQRRIARAGGN